ncbi:ATP-dependent protease [Zhengella mangrovi]|uniref:ATP-dependent protease n=1 Tax=Zhengella mangrovi TaxID=1982044 RepID=A0A2G1QSU9_9HYPH|nr:LON peptidase substrate-binding domain-containing protein [Zhengella mangrovi]PHP68603.1 ATP-dependent protease [Zhengella mangrovi]
MQVGNARYRGEHDLAAVIPVFPLSGALLLPGGRMPLNIFEPRYLQMVDDALAGGRHIGMIQPSLDGAKRADGEPGLCHVGCMGRITSFAETGDGRYIISLDGVTRFRVIEELTVRTPYRQAKVSHFIADLKQDEQESAIDREALLTAFRAYLDANDMEADWESVTRAANVTLVNALSMMAPYGAAEKQALLEAGDLKSRAETLVAITEMALRDQEDSPINLQ